MLSQPFSADELFVLTEWAHRVHIGEVTPREVSEKVREVIKRLRDHAAEQERQKPLPVASDGSALWTVRETAEWMRWKVSAVYDAIYAHRIPPECVVKVGRKVLIHSARLMSWIDAGGNPLPKGGLT